MVPDEALEQGVGTYTTRVSLHFTHPLIVEEAVRSGLFDEQQMTEMLHLARNMRAHQVGYSMSPRRTSGPTYIRFSRMTHLALKGTG
jgi:hypothetical protein